MFFGHASPTSLQKRGIDTASNQPWLLMVSGAGVSSISGAGI
jgi:hypothetical protein